MCFPAGAHGAFIPVLTSLQVTTVPRLPVVPAIAEFISLHSFICSVTTGNQLDVCALWVKCPQGETCVHPSPCQQLPLHRISQKGGGTGLGLREIPSSLPVCSLCLLRGHGEGGCPFTSTAAAFASQD